MDSKKFRIDLPEPDFLIVRVYANDVARTNRKIMFERSLYINSDFVVPYQEIISRLSFLFGDQSIIEFSLSKD